MALDARQSALLRRPFRADEHEWVEKLTFISQNALITRFTSIDPSWECDITPPQLVYNIFQVNCRITVCGVSRSDTGAEVVYFQKDSNKKILTFPPGDTPYLTDENRPMAAATRAFKRAAMLFSGLYLKGDTPFLKVPDIALDGNHPTELGWKVFRDWLKPIAAHFDAQHWSVLRQWTDEEKDKFGEEIKRRGLETKVGEILGLSPGQRWIGTLAEAMALLELYGGAK